MTKNKILIAAILAAVCFLLSAASNASAYNVYPDDPYWTSDEEGTGTAAISADQPNNGNASLALTTSTPFEDWAYYTCYAEEGTSWGLLSEIEALSFDWYRETEIDEDYLAWDPWNVQTPVLRLLIQDGDTLSELIWEEYYTDANPLLIGEWNYNENLIDQNFWRHTITDEGYTLYDGTEVYPYTHEDPLLATTLSDWATLQYPDLEYPYSEDAVVYGLSIGVGNMWPGEYIAYVDNIFLSFNNANGIVIDANFELPESVPEPATMLLFGSGMGIIAMGRRWRRKKNKA